MSPQRDPRTLQWTLGGNKPFLVAILIGYVYLVRHAGPKFMSSRKPFVSLKPLVLIYNCSMMLANCYFLVSFLTKSYLGGGYNVICQGIDYEARDKGTMEVLDLFWWFHLLRIAEFLDTIFFVLLKEDSRASVVHVVHHGLVVVNGWLGLAYGADGHVALSVVVNCFVHVIMYCYYSLSLLGPAVRPYLWWKRYLTKLRLGHLVVMCLHNMIPIFKDCGYPKFRSVIIVSQVALFFTLRVSTLTYLRLSRPGEKYS